MLVIKLCEITHYSGFCLVANHLPTAHGFWDMLSVKHDDHAIPREFQLSTGHRHHLIAPFLVIDSLYGITVQLGTENHEQPLPRYFI